MDNTGTPNPPADRPEADPAPSAPATPTPTEPRGMDTATLEAARSEASRLAVQVRERSADLTLARQVASIGGDVEERASGDLRLLDERLGRLMQDLEGSGSAIPQNLVQLRRVMDELNPHARLEEAKNPRGLLRLVPRFLRRVPGIGQILADIAVRYQSLKTQVEAVEAGLRSGCDQLLEDNIGLEQLYGRVQATHREVSLVAYKGELLWGELERAKEETDDAQERRRLDAVIGKVARRVQDLRTMEQVFHQFYASIELTTENNQNLIESAKRTIVVTGNLLRIGLALQVALVHQKKVAHAVRSTQEYTADLLAANAKTIRDQTVEIGEMNNNPVLALDKVTAAYDDLLGAMDEMERVRSAGVENARTAIGQLKTMSSGLEERVAALRSVKEASDLTPAE